MILMAMTKRGQKKVKEYMNEAFDKVWYMRSHPCDIEEIEKERVKNIKRIEKKYPEVKEYDGQDYGYWCGVLSTTRWFFSDLSDEEKNDLDT